MLDALLLLEGDVGHAVGPDIHLVAASVSILVAGLTSRWSTWYSEPGKEKSPTPLEQQKLSDCQMDVRV